MPEIRGAVLDDARALAGLSAQLGYPAGVAAMTERLSRILDHDDEIVLVSCGDRDLPVGWVHAATQQLLVSERSCEILGLIVDAGWRRQGRAERLVRAAEQWAEGRGARQMTVRSNVVRPESHPFYARVGYAQVKTQHVYRKQWGSAGRAAAPA